MNVIYIVLGAILLVTGVAVLVKWLSRGLAHREQQPQTEEPEVCCGQHATCEKDSLLAGVSKDIEYFDDEELDTYAGRDSNEYDDDEVDRFREVLMTMHEQEVPLWVRSLQLRQIAFPDELKDELLLLVREQRFER